MKYTVSFCLFVLLSLSAKAQTTDSLGLFKQFDSAMNVYKAARTTYDLKREKLESVKSASVDVSSLSVAGATEKTKALAAAKLEKETAAYELNARKKAAVELATKTNKIYQEKQTVANTLIQNADKEMKAKQAAVKALQAKEAKAKGKAKAAVTKELVAAKTALMDATNKYNIANKNFIEATSNSQKANDNLQAVNSMPNE